MKQEQTELSQDRGELRARFTVWLEVVVKRARIDYIRKKKRTPESISLESIPEDRMKMTDEDFELNYLIGKQSGFYFEEEEIEQAFSSLPLNKQDILILLFVEEKTPEEIAEKLKCTVQNVYNQRSLALKRLREYLKKGDGKL